MCRHDALKSFATFGIGTEPDRLPLSLRVRKSEEKGCAGLPNPNFRGIDAMPMRSLPGCEKKKNRADRAPPSFFRPVPPDFAEMAAFRMRLQV